MLLEPEIVTIFKDVVSDISQKNMHQTIYIKDFSGSKQGVVLLFGKPSVR
jgi:hypothetical protein